MLWYMLWYAMICYDMLDGEWKWALQIFTYPLSWKGGVLLATKWPQQILTTSAPLEAFNDIERPPWMCWHAFVCCCQDLPRVYNFSRKSCALRLSTEAKLVLFLALGCLVPKHLKLPAYLAPSRYQAADEADAKEVCKGISMHAVSIVLLTESCHRTLTVTGGPKQNISYSNVRKCKIQ